MTSQEFQQSYAELARLADELRGNLISKSPENLQRVVMDLGLVVANMGRMVIECNTQLGEITSRERSRDRGPVSLRDERAMRFFAELKPDDRERLVRAVETTSPNISIKAFAEHIANQTQMPSWQTNDLLLSVGSWYAYLAQRETEDDVNRVLTFLLEPFGFEESTKELLLAVDASNPSSTFTQQLKRLLRCHTTLGVAAKAENLLGRNERQFGSATISTEIRPIFAGNVDAVPIYGLVLHNLILGVNDGGILRSIGLSLTSSDILTLADVLSRAWKKENTLRKHSAYKLLPLGT